MADKPMALCYCGAPLMMTFAFSGYEFYCLECGSVMTFFGPNSDDWNSKTTKQKRQLEKQYNKLETEWDEIAPKLIGGGVMLQDCLICTREYEPHLLHATDEEKQVYKDTLQYLEDRAA